MQRTRGAKKARPKRRTRTHVRVPPPAGALMRIRAVAAATNVPEPTLRAWERRYGIPTPTRTASGYRLYGAEHVEQVRRMRELCDAGVAAAEAARLVLSSPNASAEPARVSGTEDVYTRAVAILLAYVERFDEVALAEATRRLFGLGDSITLLDRVIRPVLIEVGERWHRGELSVAHEHLASHVLRDLLSDLVRLTPTPANAPRAVLACFENEEHDLGLLGLSLRLASWGVRPVMLGARTPPGALRNALASKGAALVSLSVSVAPERARARALLDDYAAACAGTPWIVGGPGAAPLVRMIEALGGHVEPKDSAALQTLVLRLVHGGRAARP